MPTTMAVSQSPTESALAARAVATKEEEQAVSKVTLGPCVPRKYDTEGREGGRREGRHVSD